MCAELGLRMVGFALDSSPILAQSAVTAKKSLAKYWTSSGKLLRRRRLVILPPYETLGYPRPGGGIPLDGGMDSRSLALPCSSEQLLGAALIQQIRERMG